MQNTNQQCKLNVKEADKLQSLERILSKTKTVPFKEPFVSIISVESGHYWQFINSWQLNYCSAATHGTQDLLLSPQSWECYKDFAEGFFWSLSRSKMVDFAAAFFPKFVMQLAEFFCAFFCGKLLELVKLQMHDIVFSSDICW